MKIPEPKLLSKKGEPERWYIQVMVGGKRYSKSFGDKDAAVFWATGLKTKMAEASKSPRNMTLGDAIDRYIDSKDSVLSPSTILGYKKLRKNTLQSIMNVEIKNLTQEAIQKSINEMSRSKSPKYVKNAHGLLSAVLSVYAPNIVLRTTLPQKRKYEIQIPTTEEIDLLAEKVKGKKFELPFLLAAWLGLRTSEIRGLMWDCISGDTLHVKRAKVSSIDGERLKATKTYSGDRKLKMPQYILELIQQQPKTDEYIMHYNRNQLYKCLELMCKRYGLPHYRFHDLRHYQASVMLALGVPDKYAMERMGHASTNMLKNVYQHTMTSKSKEVADMVDSYFEKNLHTDLHTEK